MPIVANTVELGPQIDGRLVAVVRFYDQDGLEYLQTFSVSPEANVKGIVDEHQIQLNVTLAEAEYMAIIGG